MTRPPSEPVFNAPLAALLVIASIPALNLVQESVHYDWLQFAFRPDSLTHGDWWPGIVTAMFLHAGWGHALMNALGALAFAPPVARLFPGLRGGAAFVAFYMVCGVVAALGYGLIHINSDALMVGASGAVFGLTGAAIRLLGRRNGRLRSLTDKRVVSTSVALMAVNLAVGLIGFAPGVDAGGIAWEAHAVGYLFGLVAIGPWAKVFGERTKFDSPGDSRDPAG
ncbi:rhomboid family intramembrane serine protease [Brevundimonas kwangchunensis]|uniref:Rhomboid family intramembrane serine protease n=1 Tax=Brevundimonas kwangchunensis TaxID=322163 RepID=A0ABN1H6T1_9CAUL